MPAEPTADLDSRGMEATRAAVRLAEQATLGALLLDPAIPAQLTGWLRAEDFDDAWHRTVYTAIREIHTACRTPDAPAVAAALVDRHGYRLADHPRILDLLHAVPARPRPAHYAAIVLEASLRRQVACHAVLLEAAALASALDTSAGVLDAVSTQVDASVEHAQTRWAIAARATATLAATGETSGRVLLPSPVAADRLLSRHPLPDPDAVAGREADLVGALANRPEHIDAVQQWLEPDALTSSLWRPVYTALLDLRACRAPIDAVTLSWQTARTAHLNGPGPGTRALDEHLAYAAAIDPVHAAVRVAADQLRLAAHRTADQLRADAANPGLDVRDLLDTALLHTRALRAAAVHLDPRSAAVEELALEMRPATARRRHLAVVSR